MQIDFSAPIRDLKGNDIPIEENGKQVSDKTTLGSVAIMALLATFSDEKDVSGAEKVKRFKLANAIEDALAMSGKLDVTVEQAALVARVIDKGFPPLVVGRAHEIIDGAGS